MSHLHENGKKCVWYDNKYDNKIEIYAGNKQGVASSRSDPLF